MALTPRLDLRQSQSLVMTPQLQQAIKLLQLSAIELADFVTAELEQNPLLEREEGGEGSGETEAGESQSGETEAGESETGESEAGESESAGAEEVSGADQSEIPLDGISEPVAPPLAAHCRVASAPYFAKTSGAAT